MTKLVLNFNLFSLKTGYGIFSKIDFAYNFPFFLNFFFVSRRFLKLLSIYNFELPNVPTKFTFSLEKILKLKIEALCDYLSYTQSNTKRRNTHHY